MPIVRGIIRNRTSGEWLSELRAQGVPCGRINTVAQALSDPHVLERGMIVELEHPALGLVKSLATPVHLSDTPLVYRRHPPTLGEHTDEVMTELGLTPDAIAALRAGGVLA
jgi:crotonobetainyl-CoA:carnitine CoA-transferase CaiB-like acyl-CoA transferase